jgi:hypothetical protein
VTLALGENMKTNDYTPVFKFLNRFLPYLENAGVEPTDGSPAAMEIKSFERRESIETAFSQAAQSFISATDHLEALDALIKMECFAMAPWSCARGMIEASVISAWLLEPGIGPKERVGRSLSLRYTALLEQEKMARYYGDHDLVEEIKDRIKYVENIAVDLGFPVLKNKKGLRTGIGQVKPAMTALIERQFKGENLYRILSGMIHADYTSLTTLSFRQTAFKTEKGALLIRAVQPEIQLALIYEVAPIYAKCAWLRTIQFGFDAAKVAVLLEELYDGLRLPDANSDRFWRTVIGRSG